jgi:hypothetical protein
MILCALIAAIAIDPATAAFDMIQVDWIADTGTVKNMEQVINTPAAQLIRLLGDDRYAVRRLAIREIRFLGEDAFDALCWGRRVNDKAIAHACQLLIDELFMCPECEGEGEIKVGDSKIDNPWDHESCKACGGTGDLRMEWLYWWNDAEMRQVQTMQEKDFFGGKAAAK